MRSWRNTCASPTRRAPRSASRDCRAARWSRSTPSCTPIKASVDKKLDKLGLRSRCDLVLHLPLRYEDETVLTAPQAAPAGRAVCVQAPVLKAQVMYRPKRQLVVHAEGLVLRFFNFYPSQLKQFQRAADEGQRVRAHGELRRGFFGAEMAHPRYRIVREGEPLPEALTPIYPTTDQLKQQDLRAAVLSALESEVLDDTLPDALRRELGLAEFAASVRLLHRPLPTDDLSAAWRRVKFDELLAQQLSMRFAYRARRARRAPVLTVNGPLLQRFLH